MPPVPGSLPALAEASVCSIPVRHGLPFPLCVDVLTYLVFLVPLGVSRHFGKFLIADGR
jgi:hypothetical protein